MTIAFYCFAERKKDLFAEALTRGSLAAARDWPRPVATVDDAQMACAQLRLETCCVSDEIAYRSLTESAWLSAYRSYHEQISEKEGVQLAFLLREMPFEEALVFVRASLHQNERVQAEFKRGYEEYVAIISRASV